MASIDRHEVHQFLCMVLSHCAQYGRCEGLQRFLLTLPGNGTLFRVSQWIERFSPYKVLLDEDRHRISLIREQGRDFDPAGAATTPYWKFPGKPMQPAA